MKIFHIGICVYNDPIWISRALMQASDYAECRPEDPHIIDKVRAFKPDLIFMQVQSPVLELDIIRELSKIAFIINWMGDVRNHTENWFFQWSPYVLNCFSNMRDVEALRKLKAKAEFLQIGIDPLIFNKQETTKKNDVVFLANRYNNFPLSKYRQDIVYYLHGRLKERFTVCGNGWPFSNCNLNHSQHAENEFYNESKIAISISHFDIDRYFSDRLIRIMGAGCFALSHHYKGIEKDFKVGHHIDTFHNADELLSKIHYYLEHETEREQIALAGHNHVQENFSTRAMTKNIIEIYGRYKG